MKTPTRNVVSLAVMWYNYWWF